MEKDKRECDEEGISKAKEEEQSISLELHSRYLPSSIPRHKRHRKGGAERMFI